MRQKPWMIVGDLHGQLPLMEEVLFHIGKYYKGVIVVGDMEYYPRTNLGTWEHYMGDRPEYTGIPKYFIRGNHEDHLSLPLMVDEPQDTLFGSWKYIPDGYILDGLFCVGGAWSIDARNRPPFSPFEWQREEQLDTDQQQIVRERFHAGKENIKAILSHDIPNRMLAEVLMHGVSVEALIKRPHWYAPNFTATGEFLNEVQDLYEALELPSYRWYFGHHHKPYYKKHGETTFHGLDLARGDCIDFKEYLP